MMRSSSRSSSETRSRSSGGGKTPDSGSLDVSPSSAHSSSASSAGSGSSSGPARNPVRLAVRALGSCFAPSATVAAREEFLEEVKDPKPSSFGSTHGSERRRSGRGLYVSGCSSSQREPRSMTFTMAEIQKATNNFCPSFKLGQGGFGSVYKGRLDDGTIVAVKRATKNACNNQLKVEFQSEIQTLSRVEHLNLVRFIGYLEYEDEKIVILEYVPNGTLREHLDCMHGNPLDLAARLDIAIDIAHAVTYLHMYTDHPIIHRDIKSSNILLTENLRAKVADFGFAQLGATEAGITHISTQVKGTAGYLDPEYLKTYQLTEKSDVFSFGVLLVELVSGRRPIELKREIKERITAKWAMKKFMEGSAIQTLDPNLPQPPATNLAVEKILELALLCLAPTRQNRPSMRRCAEILWGIRKDYRELLSSDHLCQVCHQRNPSVGSTKEAKS